jgi:hypothetical protein
MAPGSNQYQTTAATYTGTSNYTISAPPVDRPALLMDIALDDLQGLLALLTNTFQRTRSTADRLLGGEPSPLAKEGNQNAEVLPISIRLAHGLREAHAIGEAIRHQVERLETL